MIIPIKLLYILHVPFVVVIVNLIFLWKSRNEAGCRNLIANCLGWEMLANRDVMLMTIIVILETYTRDTGYTITLGSYCRTPWVEDYGVQRTRSGQRPLNNIQLFHIIFSITHVVGMCDPAWNLSYVDFHRWWDDPPTASAAEIESAIDFNTSSMHNGP